MFQFLAPFNHLAITLDLCVLFDELICVFLGQVPHALEQCPQAVGGPLLEHIEVWLRVAQLAHLLEDDVVRTLGLE